MRAFQSFLLNVPVLMIVLGLSFGVSANPELENQTRSALISKLTQVQLTLSAQDKTKLPLTLRLADLHAERGRYLSNQELAQGCAPCTGGVQDRKKALSLYKEVLSQLSVEQLGKVLPQMGHLYQMLGEENQAIETYRKVLTSSSSPEAQAEAQLSLAEVYFKKRDFSVAETYYDQVLKNPKSNSLGLAHYRKAWTQFHQGHVVTAIDLAVKQLKTPSLLTRGGGSVQDPQFTEEVSRDLVTFLAKTSVRPQEIQLVWELSPSSVQISNSVYLASELERLGQTGASVMAWQFVYERQTQPADRLESMIHLSQLEQNLKNHSKAIEYFQKSLELWGLLKCEGPSCTELKARLKNFVIDWHTSEKKNPTPGLLQAYGSFLAVFPEDLQMRIWRAQVAAELQDYKLAYAEFSQVSESSGSLKEAALLGMIEVAEKSKEAQMIGASLEAYHKNSSDKKKATEVQYQLAKHRYDQGQYPQAVVQLTQYAKEYRTTQPQLALQAANLSLDALVLAGESHKVHAQAGEYAQMFPQAKTEFVGIQRKSALTRSAEAFATQKDPQKAWDALQGFDLQGASAEEKKIYLKNRVILAEKLKNFTDARLAVDQFLALGSLSAEEVSFGLERKSFLSELVLDFDSALIATRKMTGKDEKKILKMALLSELSMKDASPFYREFLKTSQDQDKKLAIAVQLVKASAQPRFEIQKQKSLLEGNPEIYAGLILDLYADGRMKLEEITDLKKISSTSSGKILARFEVIRNLTQMKTLFAQAVVDGSSQAKLARTLKARVQLLEKQDRLTQAALESGDWTSQVLSLHLVANENERFYQEVLALPVPPGFTPEQEQEYLTLLSQQAGPHQVKAQDVRNKLNDLWATQDLEKQIMTTAGQAKGSAAQLIETEFKALQAVAPENFKAGFDRAIASSKNVQTGGATVALAEVENAKNKVRQNPLSVEALRKLADLERQSGKVAMVNYLESRIENLKETEGVR